MSARWVVLLQFSDKSPLAYICQFCRACFWPPLCPRLVHITLKCWTTSGYQFNCDFHYENMISFNWLSVIMVIIRAACQIIHSSFQMTIRSKELVWIFFASSSSLLLSSLSRILSLSWLPSLSSRWRDVKVQHLGLGWIKVWSLLRNRECSSIIGDYKSGARLLAGAP